MERDEEPLMIRGDQLLLALDVLGLAADVLHVPQNRRLSQLKAIEHISRYHGAMEPYLAMINQKLHAVLGFVRNMEGRDLVSVDILKTLRSEFHPADLNLEGQLRAEALDDLLGFIMSFTDEANTAEHFEDVDDS